MAVTGAVAIIVEMVPTKDVYLLSWLEASQHSLDRSSLVEFIAYIHLHGVGATPSWGITS